MRSDNMSKSGFKGRRGGRACRAGNSTNRERVGHDPLDGASAAAALDAAAKTAINLSGRAWLLSDTRYRAAYVVIAQHIAGTDDHDVRASHQGAAPNGTACPIPSATDAASAMPLLSKTDVAHGSIG